MMRRRIASGALALIVLGLVALALIPLAGARGLVPPALTPLLPGPTLWPDTPSLAGLADAPGTWRGGFDGAGAAFARTDPMGETERVVDGRRLRCDAACRAEERLLLEGLRVLIPASDLTVVDPFGPTPGYRGRTSRAALARALGLPRLDNAVPGPVILAAEGGLLPDPAMTLLAAIWDPAVTRGADRERLFARFPPDRATVHELGAGRLAIIDRRRPWPTSLSPALTRLDLGDVGPLAVVQKALPPPADGGSWRAYPPPRPAERLAVAQRIAPVDRESGRDARLASEAARLAGDLDGALAHAENALTIEPDHPVVRELVALRLLALARRPAPPAGETRRQELARRAAGLTRDAELATVASLLAQR